jgi:hypothetical protein
LVDISPERLVVTTTRETGETVGTITIPRKTS